MAGSYVRSLELSVAIVVDSGGEDAAGVGATDGWVLYLFRYAGVIRTAVSAAALLLCCSSLAAAGASSGPQNRLAGLSPGPPADPSKPPPSRPCPDPPCFDPSAGRTAPAFMQWVGNDVARFWKRRVEALPYRWTPAHEVVVPHGKAARSKCVGVVSSSYGPFYCTFDRP